MHQGSLPLASLVAFVTLQEAVVMMITPRIIVNSSQFFTHLNLLSSHDNSAK